MPPTYITGAVAALLALYVASGFQPTTSRQQVVGSPCPHAFRINTNYHYRNSLHFVCLSRAGATGRPRLDVIQFAGQRVVMSREVDELAVDQLASFVDADGWLRILLAVPDRKNGTTMYSLDTLGKYVDELHTINTQYVSAMSIWKLELNWEWQLAIANQATYEPQYASGPQRRQLVSANHNPQGGVPDPKPMISIHSWRSTYFDSYEVIYLPESDSRITKLEPMHVNGQEFLVVALEPERQHQFEPDAAQVSSLIYRLDFGDGSLTWTHFQNLDTKMALDAKSFAISHQGSLQRDYYVAMLGRLGANSSAQVHAGNQMHPRHGGWNGSAHGMDASESESYGLIIFKYFGDQFMSTHWLPVAGATRLDAITYGQGDTYVIVALISGPSQRVDLYLFDGLQLKPIHNPLAPPQRQVAYPPPASPAGARSRRTMPDASSFHLFHLPATPQDASGNQMSPEGAAKRTLADDSADLAAQLTMPALAISRQPDEVVDNQQQQAKTTTKANINTTTTTTPSDSVYYIPVNEMIREEETSTAAGALESDQPGHAKRNLRANGGESLFTWCKATIERLIGDQFEHTSRQLLALPRIDQSRPIVLNGDLVIKDDLHVSNLLYVKQVKERVDEPIDSIAERIVDSIESNFSTTFAQIQRSHSEIDQVKRQVDQILVDDGTDQEVFSPLTMDTVVIECLTPNSLSLDPRYQHMSMLMGPSCPRVDVLRTNWLNSRDISDIQQQALIAGRAMTITSNVRFEHLVLRGTAEILGTLNDLSINDIVFKRGPSAGPVTGHKHFRQGLYSASRLEVNSWEGAQVGHRTFLTTTGEQRIEAPLRFQQVILDPMTLTGGGGSAGPGAFSRFERLNGHHLDSHLHQIAMQDDSNIFDIPIHFEELILNGPITFHKGSRLASIDLDDQLRNIMFKGSNQNITAPLEFAGDVHISYGGEIIVNGPINGIYLNQTSVMMRNLDYSLPNRFIFEHDVQVRGDLKLGLELNGIQVVKDVMSRQDAELAILYNGGDQLVTGDKIFTNIVLGGRSYISGFINGHLNLTQLYMLANGNNGQPYRFANIRLKGSNIRLDERMPGAQMFVGSTVNGVPVNNMCALANSLVQAPQVAQYQRLRFEHPLRFQSLRCASINGFNNLSRAFLTRHGDQQVLGSLRLTNGLVFNTSVSIQHSLNNMGVGPMALAVAKTVNETRTGHKDVMGDLWLDELYAERINDLHLSNVLVTKSDIPLVVRAPLRFDHLDIENVLNVGNNFVTKTFNGLDMSDLLTNTLQYDTEQIIYNHVQLNNLQILPNANLLTKSLNGHDLQKLYADSVLIDVPQQILATKTFRAPVEFAERLFLRYGIDELTEQELKFNLLLHSDELIAGDLEFFTDIIVKQELEIKSGIINDIDIQQFVDTMLYENRPDQKGMRVFGNGSVRFKDVRVNNLVVAGTIQGVDLSKEALLRSNMTNTTTRIQTDQYYPASYHQTSTAGNNAGAVGYQPQPVAIGQPQLQQIPRQMFMINQTRPVLMPQPVQYGFSQRTTIQPPYTYGVPVVYAPQPTPRPQQYQPSRLPQPPHMTPQPQQHHEFNFNTPQHFYPNILPRPLSLVNVTTVTWKPSWSQLVSGLPPIGSPVPQPPAGQVYSEPRNLNRINATQPIAQRYGNVQTFELWPNAVQQGIPAVGGSRSLMESPKYIEYKSMMQAQAIRDLASRINKYLSMSFYYEIFQKHPGPLLHAASNPILNDLGSALLMLKGTNNPGEPFLKRGQSVAVIAWSTQKRERQPKSSTLGRFTQMSLIQETSDPTLVESLMVGANDHYLFILDSIPNNGDEQEGTMSRVLIYFWDYQSGRYERRDQLVLDGFPTRLKSFSYSGLGCLALANPIVQYGSSYNGSVIIGAPLLYCQTAPRSRFSQRTVLSLANVFDLDVIVPVPWGKQVLIATLSQQYTEQVGDLTLSSFDFATRSLANISIRRMVRPLKLHFFRDSAHDQERVPPSEAIRLAVSEAITSNDAAQAMTRIFTLRPTVPSRLEETQIIKDNQFHDIQSIKWMGNSTLLFLQSAHSIAIYAPDCEEHFSILHRLPTKGAHKFTVFNERGSSGHFLALSNQYSTLILKTKK